MYKINNNFEILTPTGFSDFKGVRKIYKENYYHFEFSNGSNLNCADDHLLDGMNGYKFAKDYSVGDLVHTNKGSIAIIKIEKIDNRIELFDPLSVEKNEEYFSNGITSHNCFLGSSNTLISGQVLRRLVWRNHIREHTYGVKIFEEPIKAQKDDDTGEVLSQNHQYAICVDVAEGKELNSSAFTVIDVTDSPYQVVATFKDNTISTLLYPTIIWDAAKLYNDAYVLVETNSIGKQVADILHNDLEYENLLKVAGTGDKRQQQVSAWSSRGVEFGIRMSPSVKRIGCTNLKTLVEANKLIINSKEIFDELGKFVQATNGTYAAEMGEDDDITMSLVIFGWLTTQKYFKDLVSHNIRKELRDQFVKINDEEETPLMVVSTGKEQEFETWEGDIWMGMHEGSNQFDPYKGWMDNFKDRVDPDREESENRLRERGLY